MKKAFTLAETLIVLVIIGVIAIIVISAIGNLQPDKEKIMFKKAYSITERAVGELVNDETIYPYNPNRIGFRNTDTADVEGTSESYGGAEKFCQFFGRKLNTFAPPQFDGVNLCTFQTTDGMDWSVMSDFQDTTERVVVFVDVNGNDIDPNLPTYSLSDVAANDDLLNTTISTDPDLTNDRRDRFYIYVYFDGKVGVAPNSVEESFLRSHEAQKRR